MKSIDVTQAGAPLSDFLETARAEPLIITEPGRPTLVLMAASDVDLESVSLATNPKFIEIIEQSRRRSRVEGDLSAEEMRRRVSAMPP